MLQVYELCCMHLKGVGITPDYMSSSVGFWRSQNGPHFYELYCRLRIENETHLHELSCRLLEGPRWFYEFYCRLRIENESHFHELYCRLLEGVGVDPSDRINPQPCVPSIVNTCIK
jgi:hypothetical protein